jgi:hypothetical protein
VNICYTGFISKAAKLALPHNSAKLNFIPDFFKNLSKKKGKLINPEVKINFSGKKLKKKAPDPFYTCYVHV